jgi:hypothetical protein
MEPSETVYDKTYQYYLEQIAEISFGKTADILGAKIEGNELKIPFFQNEYTVSVNEMTDPAGKKPTYDIIVILSKYILRCPDAPPKGHDWVSFKDFKDSGPLISFFANNVERNISDYFSGKSADLNKASKSLGGYLPTIEVNYDLAYQFNALPKMPIMLLFNDADEEFSASCSILFQSRAEKFLDAECLAMVGSQLYFHLKKWI